MNRIRARELRKNMTEAERVLWKHLRLRQIHGLKFRRQQPIGKYIVDFICFEKRLIIELDGGQHSEQIVYDLERDTWLERQGFHILRFWNDKVLKETEVVKEVILEALSHHSDTPPTLILPHKGGGDDDNGESHGKEINGGYSLYKMIIYGIILLCQLLLIPSVHAWQLPIEVATYTDKGDKVYNKLVAGIESSATDGFDNLWDTQALVTSPDMESQPMLRAYFTPPPILPPQGGEEKGATIIPSPHLIGKAGEGKGGGGGVNLRLWKDTRGPVQGNTTWDITIDSVPPGKIVVISWNTPQGLLKAGERLVLNDSGVSDVGSQTVQTDVSQTSSYVYVSHSDEPRSLALVLSRESSNTSRSGGGSGFGCGTIKLHDNRPSGGGTAALGIIALFSPLVLRLLRNRSL
ncbi:MAG: endonuclease domain-containing protein [Nitrospirae bacterium]|nr:endonuclease domain-containing protein [Nitrospirota bacterium]